MTFLCGKTVERHGEAIESIKATLDEHNALIKARVEATDFEDLQRDVKKATLTLGDLAADFERQKRDARERIAALEEAREMLELSLAGKLEAEAHGHADEHLRRRTTRLEEQSSEILAALSGKACANHAEVQRARLEALCEEVAELTKRQVAADLAMGEKAESRALAEQRARSDAIAEALGREIQDRKGDPRVTALVGDHALLAERAALLESRLESLSGTLEATSCELMDGLSRRADLTKFEAQEDRLTMAVSRITQNERTQQAVNDRVMEELRQKQDAEAARVLRNQMDERLSACATQAELADQLERLELQLASTMRQLNVHCAETAVALDTKLNHEAFNAKWDEVIDGDVRPTLEAQQAALQTAVAKKNQLMAMVHDMHADLRCALALKGRGPSGLPQRLAPVKIAPSRRDTALG